MPVCIGGNSPVRRKVLATPFELPEKSIREEHGRCTHPGVNYAEPAVEEAAVKDIVAPKPEGRPQREIAERRPPTFGGEIDRARAAVGDDLVEVMSQVLVGRVVQLVCELTLF